MATLKRDDNPPNVPQLCPIEDFGGVMKQEVYRGGWVASSEAKLKKNCHGLDQNRPRSAAHHDEGGSVCACALKTVIDLFP